MERLNPCNSKVKWANGITTLYEIVHFNRPSPCQLRIHYTTFWHFLRLVHKCGLGSIETSFAIGRFRDYRAVLRWVIRARFAPPRRRMSRRLPPQCAAVKILRFKAAGTFQHERFHSAGEWYGSLRPHESRKKSKIQLVNRTVNV